MASTPHTQPNPRADAPTERAPEELDAPEDDATWRARTARAALVPFAFCLAAFFALSVPIQLLIQAPHAVAITAGHGAVAALVFFLMGLRLHARPLPLAFSHAFTALISVLCTTGPIAYSVALGPPAGATGLILIVAASGPLHLSRRWLAVTLTWTIGVWLTITLLGHGAFVFSETTLTIASSFLFTLVGQNVRLATLRNVRSFQLQAIARQREAESTRAELQRAVVLSEQRAEQLHHEARHDALTALPNRKAFLEALGDALDRYKEDPKSNRFGVLFIDLDRFKYVNDTLGHLAGDELLVKIAHRIARATRDGDLVARLSGDEFAVLTRPITDEDEPAHLAQAIRNTFEAPFVLEGEHEVVSSASIGIAISKAKYTRPEDILRDSDLAMYEAKARGKNQPRTFRTDMHAALVEDMRLSMDLYHAIERQQLHIHFQPVIALGADDAGRPLAFEARLQWQHPERGLLDASAFMPLAQEIGIHAHLQAWALQSACRHAAAWRALTRHPPKLTIDLAPDTFKDPDFPAQLDDTLRHTGLLRQDLAFELSEATLIGLLRDDPHALDRLTHLDVALWIDHYGQDFASINLFRSFPATLVKIQASFIETTLRTRSSTLDALMSAARDRKLEIVALNVDTPAQRRAIEHLALYGAQGDALTPALDADATEAHIARSSSKPSAKLSARLK